jgi:predicted  nucleic acid-binding Zn-ribbon protein
MIAPLAALLRIHEARHEGGLPLDPDTSERLTFHLGAPTLRRYEMATKRLGADAVAPIERGACSRCHVLLPRQPKTLADDIYQCESCGRILYDPEVAFDLSVG